MKTFKKLLLSLAIIFTLIAATSNTVNATNLSGRAMECTAYGCVGYAYTSVQLFTWNGFGYVVYSTVAYTDAYGYYGFVDVDPGYYAICVDGTYNFYNKLVLDEDIQYMPTLNCII